MGQGQSSGERYTSLNDNDDSEENDSAHDLLVNNPVLRELDTKIKETRLKLYEIKVERIFQQDKHGQEIYELEMELYKKRTRLMQLGKSCQDAFSFSDYISIIQRTYRSRTTPTRPINTIFREDGERPDAAATASTSTEIVPQYFTLSYTIFAWFEAYLLKRLHLAMLQRKQQTIHTKTWSGIVADLYFELPALKKNFEKKLGELFLRKQNMEIVKHQKADAYANHVRLQAKAIMILEQASWEEQQEDSEVSKSSRGLQFDARDSFSESSNHDPTTNNSNKDKKETKFETDDTAEMSSDSGNIIRKKRLSVETDSDFSRGGEEELSHQLHSLGNSFDDDNDSQRHEASSASSNNDDDDDDASQDSSSTKHSDQNSEESDITDSASEMSEEEERNGRLATDAVSVEALNEAVEQQMSTLSAVVPGDFNWQAGIEEELKQERIKVERDDARIKVNKMLAKHSAAEREQARIKAELENAKLEAGRMAQRSKRLKAKHANEIAKLEVKQAEAEQEQERLAAVAEQTRREAERIHKKEEARRKAEEERAQRTDIKVKRLNDLHSRLHEIDVATAALAPTSQGARTRQAGQTPNATEEAIADDRSMRSDRSSVKERKRQRRQSLLLAEARAREKIHALNRSFNAEDLHYETEGSTEPELEEAESVAGSLAREKAEELAEQQLEELRQINRKKERQIKTLETGRNDVLNAADPQANVETDDQIRERIRNEMLEESARANGVQDDESVGDSDVQIQRFASALGSLRGSMTKLERLSFSRQGSGLES
eukprot:scaffold408_cov71-Cylindrotheca_fusiformis.AAC.21